MADVSLDDLIKKDKEKGRVNKLKHKLKTKFNQRSVHRNNFDDRKAKGGKFDKNKPINKRFEEKFNRRREERAGRDSRPSRQQRQKPKFEKKEGNNQEKEKKIRTLKVMGLSPQFTNQDLYKLFATMGAMEKCHIQQDNFGRTLTTAIVKYYDHEAANNAILSMNRHKVMNCILTVQPYKHVKK